MRSADAPTVGWPRIGAAGLMAHALVANEAVDEDESFLVNDCLTFYLGDQEMLFPQDREVARVKSHETDPG